MPILSFLRGPIVSLVSAGLAVLLLFSTCYLGVLNWEKGRKITGLEAALSVAQLDLAQCRVNKVTLQSSLDEQNRAIQELRNQNSQTESRLRTQAEVAQQAAVSASQRAERILHTQGSSCEDADRVILENSR